MWIDIKLMFNPEELWEHDSAEEALTVASSHKLCRTAPIAASSFQLLTTSSGLGWTKCGSSRGKRNSDRKSERGGKEGKGKFGRGGSCPGGQAKAADWPVVTRRCAWPETKLDKGDGQVCLFFLLNLMGHACHFKPWPVKSGSGFIIRVY
ncbi:hypothetical protein PoB_001754300 [Plakobranchus ocellatus]|uniref:Uncharacterized protein n=1 Tax=Plakobranchus ocellatus TaxID=259542 RepID=A0AAV3Z8G2_9GAST|nr:hypothetical protein PoB_001754300 [Plakobranchus ocellatus]